MKAQLKVGKGDGDLPSIPGVTANAVADDYNASLPELIASAEAEAKIAAQTPVVALDTNKPGNVPVPPQPESFISGMTVIGLALGLLLAPYLAKKFKGMTVSEIIATIFEGIGWAFDYLAKLSASLLKLLSKQHNVLPKA